MKKRSGRFWLALTALLVSQGSQGARFPDAVGREFRFTGEMGRQARVLLNPPDAPGALRYPLHPLVTHARSISPDATLADLPDANTLSLSADGLVLRGTFLDRNTGLPRRQDIPRFHFSSPCLPEDYRGDDGWGRILGHWPGQEDATEARPASLALRRDARAGGGPGLSLTLFRQVDYTTRPPGRCLIIEIGIDP